ncbi:jg7570 [Pararge aegeria aegeria]|uniref:Jg7570 protein n=1 Tax=Pararge aegeria aegeria TaxID=348720 RepID=A0A8S4QNY4_9NEOP|nr:jg7570 [Pararge aegeria aegeria]
MKKVLCNRRLKIPLRIRLLHCYIWPILLYGCEAWTIKEDLRKRIEAFEMWTFRRMLAISWTLKVSNEEVLRRVNQRRELLHTIKIRKVAYLGHVLRHERYELLQLIMMGKVAGRRGVGRRKKSVSERLVESRVQQNYFASRKIDKNLRS